MEVDLQAPEKRRETGIKSPEKLTMVSWKMTIFIIFHRNMVYLLCVVFFADRWLHLGLIFSKDLDVGSIGTKRGPVSVVSRGQESTDGEVITSGKHIYEAIYRGRTTPSKTSRGPSCRFLLVCIRTYTHIYI